MIRRNAKPVPGIDCSGENKVCPPTFCGVKELVRRVGFDAAAAQVSKPDYDSDDASHDIVRDFLSDLNYMDAVERQTAISEFSEFVDSLQKESKSRHSAGGAPASESQGEPPKEGEPAGED